MKPNMLSKFMVRFSNERLVILLVGLLAILVYANSFPGDFILDDNAIIRKNPLILQPDFSRIFLSDYWAPKENSGLYRPVTILSFVLNRMVFGEAALGYHLVNVLLHAFNSMLLWLVLRRWSFSTATCLIASLVFAVHPLHTEVVNVIVGRSELLVGFFLLTGFWLAERESRYSEFLVYLFFALALLSKEHAITFLALSPAVDIYRHGWRSYWATRKRRFVILLLIASVWLVWRQYGLVHMRLPSDASEFTLPLVYAPVLSRVLTGLLYQWFYLAKMVVPFQLQASYTQVDLPAIISSMLSLPGLLTLSLSGVAAFYVVRGWSRRVLLAFFPLLYLISFSPTANIFLPIGITFAERLTYLPSMWYSAGIALFLTSFFSKFLNRPVVAILAGGYVLFLAFLCISRTPAFSNEITLWQTEVAQSAEDIFAWRFLGLAYAVTGHDQEAEQAFQRMLALSDDFDGGVQTWIGFLLRKGRFEEALPFAMTTLERHKARGKILDQVYDHGIIGHIYHGLGRYDDSSYHLDLMGEQLYQHPFYAGLKGLSLVNLGRYSEAVVVFDRMGPLPSDSDLPYTYAVALFHTGRLAEAAKQLEDTLFDVDNGDMWNLLGVIRAEQQDWSAAIKAFGRAVESEPERQDYRANLQRARQDMR